MDQKPVPSTDVRISRSFQAGDVVWPYRIRKVLGSGAMGDVYLAENITDHVKVALKLIPMNLQENPILAARFRRELKVLQQLRHPSIVKCLSNVQQSEEGEQLYYAMEYLGGGTLDGLLRKRIRLPAKEALTYTIQVLGALSAAQLESVIHRDVKPSNLLLTRDRRKIKLCDFGLAMVMGGTQLTQSGQTIGTPWYMSPEQIRGEDTITGATDLYAVGCILMEMLTGKPPFVADTHFGILNQHLAEEPPLVSSRVPNLEHGPLIDRIVRQLLEKKPEKRPTSPGELLRVIGEEVSLDHEPSPKRSSRKASSQNSRRSKVAVARASDFWHRIKNNSLRITMGLLLVSAVANATQYFQKSSALSSEEQQWLNEVAANPRSFQNATPRLIVLLSCQDEAAQETVRELLKSGDAHVRYDTIRALETVSAEQRSAFRREIVRLTDDPSDFVREAADAVLRNRP